MNTDLRVRLKQAGQEEIVRRLESLDAEGKKQLEDQLRGLDLILAAKLFQQKDSITQNFNADAIQSPKVILSEDNAGARRLGEEVLAKGQVAALVVAGGQATRLGSNKPKGLWPITPIRQNSLFCLHSQKILALSRKFGKPIPFLIMTSPSTHKESIKHFQENQYFGLDAGNVHFFQQGLMPALDIQTGQALFETPSQIFTSPDGHGGALAALKQSGLADLLWQQGIRDLFYFQVDNPLVKIADPLFLGQHKKTSSQLSSKVIRKEFPLEKLGNFVEVHGKCHMIEYSDLPLNLAERKTPDGQLWIGAGNPAIHFFQLRFLLDELEKGDALPFHLAKKKVPYLDSNGILIMPEKENALKFERFIFDLFPQASNWLLMETSRDEEFAPLKNASGADSPETVRLAQNRLFANWLRNAGATLPGFEDPHGKPDLEICPLFAIDEKDLKEKLPRGFTFSPPGVIDNNSNVS